MNIWAFAVTTNLQELQQLQLSNRQKLSAIDHAVEAEEMQTALEKNPNVSKERSNLLQGVREGDLSGVGSYLAIYMQESSIAVHTLLHPTHPHPSPLTPHSLTPSPPPLLPHPSPLIPSPCICHHSHRGVSGTH